MNLLGQTRQYLNELALREHWLDEEETTWKLAYHSLRTEYDGAVKAHRWKKAHDYLLAINEMVWAHPSVREFMSKGKGDHGL
jgi:hypothetical protein